MAEKKTNDHHITSPPPPHHSHHHLLLQGDAGEVGNLVCATGAALACWKLGRLRHGELRVADSTVMAAK